jgi:hypothetical protein
MGVARPPGELSLICSSRVLSTALRVTFGLWASPCWKWLSVSLFSLTYFGKRSASGFIILKFLVAPRVLFISFLLLYFSLNNFPFSNTIMFLV